jgi:polyisoprenyl-phosphate glycosyltransferase
LRSSLGVPRLSLVIPVHDEEAVLPELVRRCALAGRACTGAFELLIVNDASRDSSAAILDELAQSVPELRPIHLGQNAGQLGATKVGLSHARGELVAILDGDLQDPPELLPELFAALSDAPPEIDVVFAVKARRHERAAFLAGQAVYHLLSRLGGSSAPPSGAGSYCILRASWAARVGRLAVKRANLAAVLAALGARSLVVPYEKAARYDDASRVGPVGLAREALESLALGGTAGRALRVGAVTAFGGSMILLSRRRLGSALLLSGVAGALALAGRAADRWAGTALAEPR